MFFVSFPNFLCLLLTGVLVVHMLRREDTMGSKEELLQKDSLERMYCRMPQSYRKQDTFSCCSAQRLFLLLGNGCRNEIKDSQAKSKSVDQNKTKVENEIVNTDFTREEDTKNKVISEKDEHKEEQEKEIRSPMLDSFIISLLVGSALFSLFEIYKEKVNKSEKVGRADGLEPSQGVAGGRRISLADLTVNRHIRRGDSHHQQLETIRQNSTPSAKPPLLRRSSFPAQLPESRHRPSPQRQQSSPGVSGRRLSVDLCEDDNSPDRRRVRIIRRH